MDFHLNTSSQLVAKICAALNNLPPEVDLSAKPTVIVAISGGPDSTALLLALQLVSKQFGFEIRACHINHKLRGAESDGDEDFCRQLCGNLSLPLDVFEAPAYPEISESALREHRYHFLFHCAQAVNSRYIALAHNSNDQVETVLFRIFRGTSPNGLTGMRSARQMRNGIWLLRPMLSCDRSDVEYFLKLNGVCARVDSSNLSNKFMRNFLRNQVIPLCLTRFPMMGRQVERLRELVSVDEDFLNDFTLKIIDELGGVEINAWSTPQFSSIHTALQRRALAAAFEYRNIELSFERVQAVLDMMANPVGAKRTSLSRRWDIDVDAEKISWIDKLSTSAELQFVPVTLKVPGLTMLLSLGKVFNVEPWTGPSPSQFPSRSDMTVIADLSDIDGPLVVRKMTESDHINPLGMSQTVSVKRYLRSNRSTLQCWQGMVLADQSEVLWVPGVGLSEKIRVRVKPTHQLSISAISADFMVV
ncbi:MAG: tRNA lysidine(34) synthetase TilS [Candidatus Melainabacteria bacterium]|nr:tRNA lysidine(34) synthetase TilS [Candidatus Melainabacteria bacterium]